jgi:3'-phosphoadenosine 5'-phosphosulfate sulfotransferase (PAPS reductase)/FAD synthetase
MNILDQNIIDKLKTCKTVISSMSLGKDSVTSYDLCRKYRKDIICIYFYLCPDLNFVKKSIDLYQNFFNTEIIQLPHPALYDFIRHQDFQPLETAKHIARFDFPTVTFKQIIKSYLKAENIDTDFYEIVGMRASESFNRRMYFKKHGKIDDIKKQIYPISDYSEKEVYKYLEDNKIPLSDDYKIFRRSYDGMKYQFLFGVKKYYPDDWLILTEYFPLLESELKRYEFNETYFKFK